MVPSSAVSRISPDSSAVSAWDSTAAQLPHSSTQTAALRLQVLRLAENSVLMHPTLTAVQQVPGALDAPNVVGYHRMGTDIQQACIIHGASCTLGTPSTVPAMLT
jgi:hypothetical protein